ncbi:unnamed protein product [Calypogeia fissa]
MYRSESSTDHSEHSIDPTKGWSGVRDGDSSQGHSQGGVVNSTTDLVEIVEDHSESSMDHSEHSIDPTKGRSGVTRGDSSQRHSHGAQENQSDHSHDTSAVEQRDVAHEGARHGSKGIEITGMDELMDAIKNSKLSHVTNICLYLHNQDIGSGYLTIAEALESGEMCSLEGLSLVRIRLQNDRSEAIGNALSSAKIPSLRALHLDHNHIGTKGVEALGRAIRSRNLEKLEKLYLSNAGINDDDVATLATAFQHGEASVRKTPPLTATLSRRRVSGLWQKPLSLVA